MFHTSLLILAVFGCAHASEKENVKSEAPAVTQVPLEQVKKDLPRQPASDDVDEVLTNKKLRADSGSKSKLSISNSISYKGGTVDVPLAEIRPNIQGGAGATTVATLTDTVSLKYNFTQRKSMLLGLGLRWITPFYGTATPYNYQTRKKYVGNKFDADNPVLNYQYIYKWLGIQSVLISGVTAWTRQDQRDVGYLATFDVQQVNVYEFGTSGFSLGVTLDINHSEFDRDTSATTGANVKDGQSDWGWAAFPFAEYAITQRLHLRTVSGLLTWEHRREHTDGGDTIKTKVYQSIGLGISVTRDFYLYPNVQFLPDNIRSDLTNVAVSSSLNIF